LTLCVFLIVMFHEKHHVLTVETKEVSPRQSPWADLSRVFDL
jgi:hypothetical protein